jgi:integrase
MASVRRKAGSKYWFACFTLAGGLRVQRSTKETDRKKAQRLADAFEEVTRQQTTARQAQRIVTDTYQRVTGNTLPATTTRDYFKRWLDRKEPETSNSTHLFYTGKTGRFLEWLGDRANATVLDITPEDILAFRTSENERVRPATVNHAMKVLRMVFEDAKRDRVIADNPADFVRLVKADPRRSRRPFSVGEIKQLLAAANHEWRSLILFGLYTGQRLGDLARLTWDNIDLEHDQLRLFTSKTGRRQIIPIAPPLKAHLIGPNHRKNDPDEPLHPDAFASVTKSGKVVTLSRQFYEIMARARMVPPKSHRASANGTGRGGRHTVSEISFHALRHTATSLMKNAGISSAVVQDIIGHESSAISDNYTHIDEEAKRKALSAIPNVFA